MPGPTFAEGDSVALHTVEEEDLDFLQSARNDPAIRRPLTVNEPSNGEQTRQFFEDAVSSDEGANFLVCVPDRREGTERASGEAASSVDERGDSPEDEDDARPVGMVTLFHEDRTAGTANVAYWVVPNAQGNGYATDAAGLLAEHAFADRRLHKLRAEVIESNEASASVLEKVGFQREGVLRDGKFVGGEHVDVYRYGLLATEWRDA